MSTLWGNLRSFAYVLAALVCFADAAAQASDRVALVVGNNNYRFAPKLVNPVNDARGLVTALRASGFEVIEAFDQTATQFQGTLDAFAKKVVGARIGLIYFAGHGIQYQGNTYLIPVDIDLSDERDVRKAISSDYLIQDVARAKELGIVILDACRDNPFVKQIAEAAGPTRSLNLGRGLSRLNDVPRKSLVGYATQAGNVALDGDGTNSPFAAALIKHLPTPRKDIRLVFGAVRDDVLKATDGKQEPYIYGSLGADEIHLVPGPPQVATAAPTTTAAVQPIQQLPNVSKLGAIPSDYSAWTYALQVDSWDALEAVKSASGNGIFSYLADVVGRERAAAGAPRAALARVENYGFALRGLGSPEISSIQRGLRDVNFFGGEVDGRPGNATETALRQFSRFARGSENLTVSTLVTLAERAATRSSTSELTGSWQGRYEYRDGRAGVNFVMNLIFSQGKISGSIIEPNTFGRPTAKNLYAHFSGNVNGDDIRWSKKYDGTGGVNHFVEYVGKLDRGTRRVFGTWHIGNTSGPFSLALGN